MKGYGYVDYSYHKNIRHNHMNPSYIRENFRWQLLDPGAYDNFARVGRYIQPGK